MLKHSTYSSQIETPGSKSRRVDYLSEKISSIGSLKSRAILNARGKLGSYFSVSIAFTV